MRTLEQFSFILFGLLFATSTFAENAPLKQIRKITVQSAEYTYDYTLGYDSKNRITKVVPDHSEIFRITECEYDKNTFLIFKGDTFVSCSLNKHGYIINSEDGYFPIMLTGDMYYNEKGRICY
jgi:hypothetical protein